MPEPEPTAPSVFVTGGSGFVGSAVVERLIRADRRVTALARSDESALRLEEMGADVVRGDVLDAPDDLARKMSGAGVVFHIAGLNGFCLRDPAPLYRINVLGSRNVVLAAHEAGVRKVVHTSSGAAIGEAKGTIGTEHSPHRGYWLSNYERSKYESERAVFKVARDSGVEAISVNPSSVQGPGRTTGTAKLILAYANGRLRTAVETTMSVVDIADCAEAHLLAEARGEPGQRYLVSGASMRVSDATEIMARVTGIRIRPRMLPPVAAHAGATAAELGGLLRGRRPSVCREMMVTLLHGHRYDGSRAERELGLSYTPIEETMRRTIAWYEDQGLVKRRSK
jgi:dihydroflavonol-4-reductase